MYAGRLNQVDFRVSKVVSDNIFNTSPILSLNNTFGSSWQRPLQILQGRLLKFGVQ